MDWGVCPKGLPQPVLKTLQDVVKKVTETKTWVDMTTTGGSDVYYMDSDALIKRSDSDAERVAKIYKELLLEEKK